jgi:hypothetical protein
MLFGLDRGCTPLPLQVGHSGVPLGRMTAQYDSLRLMVQHLAEKWFVPHGDWATAVATAWASSPLSRAVRMLP